MVRPVDIRVLPKLKLTGQLDSARNSLFTVCLTDLDAPSELNPAFREFRLFVAVNCKLRADNTLDLNGPDTAVLSAWPDPAEVRPAQIDPKLRFLPVLYSYSVVNFQYRAYWTDCRARYWKPSHLLPCMRTADRDQWARTIR